MASSQQFDLDPYAFQFIKTTLPYDLVATNPIITDNLIIRPFIDSDLEAFHTITSQPEAMTSDGGPVANRHETKQLFELRLPPYPYSSYYFGIFLNNGSESDLIGSGGIYQMNCPETGWPKFEYKLKKEYWGQGYTTEFAKAFMVFWKSLPREITSFDVAPSTINLNNSHQATELLYAWTKVDNIPSQKVLQKIGFESFEGLDNGLINWRLKISF